MKLSNKYVLITGAGSGIGKAIALQMADKKANLMLIGRNIERLENVRNACLEKGVKADFRQVDMANQTSMDIFAEEVLKEQWHFDCLVLNAGISQRSITLETQFEVDRKLMEVDFFGPVYLTKKLAWILKSNKHTQIMITSSISGLFGFSMRSSYCAAKHALFGFFEALEVENNNIGVTFLIPGRINTDISKNALVEDGSTYNKMDGGQANGVPVEKCARKAIRAIEKQKHRQLVGGKEMIMVHLKKWCPSIFWFLAYRVSPTG